MLRIFLCSLLSQRDGWHTGKSLVGFSFFFFLSFWLSPAEVKMLVLVVKIFVVVNCVVSRSFCSDPGYIFVTRADHRDHCKTCRLPGWLAEQGSALFVLLLINSWEVNGDGVCLNGQILLIWGQVFLKSLYFWCKLLFDSMGNKDIRVRDGNQIGSVWPILCSHL